MKLLIDAGADVNRPDTNGQTPLMLAVNEQLSGLIELLIKAGADVNMQNKEGETAVNLTASQGSVECLKLLLLQELM